MNQWPIAFHTKDFIGVVVLLGATTLTTLGLMFSQRLREIALFGAVTGAVLAERLSINFYDAYWYRGTTRGFEVTFVDILAFALLVSTVLVPRHGRERCYWPEGLGPMLLFVLAAGASVACATPQIFGWYEFSKLLRGIVVFLAAAYFVRSERELTILVLAVSAAAGLEAATSFRQRLFEGVYRVTGTLDHPNSVSMYLCLVGPLLVAASTADLPIWVRRISGFAAIAATMTVMLTLSRAGIPAFMLVAGGAAWGCGLLRPSWRNFAAATVAAVVLTVVIVKSWDLLMARYESASLEEEYIDGSGETRGYYFRQAGVVLDELPFGVGLNNWSYWVSKKFGAAAGMHYEDYDDISFPPPNELLPMYRYAAPAHNLGVLTAGELGWWGLGVFGLVWARWLGLGAGFLRDRRGAVWRRLGLGIFFGCCGVLLQSFTEWTFRQTPIFLTMHLLLGTLASLRHWPADAAEGEEAEPAIEVEAELAEAWPAER